MLTEKTSSAENVKC